MTDSPPDLSNDYRRYLAAIVVYHLSAAHRLGLGASDYQALNLLDLHGRLTAGDLARATGLTHGATTRMVDRLVDAGWVRRTADETDRRKSWIEHGENRPAELERLLASVRDHVAPAFDVDASAIATLATYFRTAADGFETAIDELR